MKTGHDSEVFAKNEHGLFPLAGVLGGTKESPVKHEYGVISEDNVSGEIAINPAESEHDFVTNTYMMLDIIEDKIIELGAELVIEPSVEFPMPVLQSIGRQAMKSGCDPDFNIMTVDKNVYPDLELDGWRHGSGHLHFDVYNSDDPLAVKHTVMYADIYVKAPQFLVEGEVQRNLQQGGLGNYRPKKYGGEYRSSSNIILKDEDFLRHAYLGINYACELAGSGNGPDYYPQFVQRYEAARAGGQKEKKSLISILNEIGVALL